MPSRLGLGHYYYYYCRRRHRLTAEDGNDNIDNKIKNKRATVIIQFSSLFIYMLSWQPNDRFQIQHSYKDATNERTDKQTNL